MPFGRARIFSLLVETEETDSWEESSHPDNAPAPPIEPGCCGPSRSESPYVFIFFKGLCLAVVGEEVASEKRCKLINYWLS